MDDPHQIPRKAGIIDFESSLMTIERVGYSSAPKILEEEAPVPDAAEEEIFAAKRCLKTPVFLF